MPRTRATAAAVKPVKPTEPEEQVELDEPEDDMEEEVEYEEIEEEEEEEEVVEEVEAEEEAAAANGDNANAITDDNMKVESDEHAELLALPPHGSEVYVGGIPQDASEEDLKNFCESVGEVAEVRVMKGKDASENKGFAFVSFKTKELAAKAIEDLNNTEFKGKKIRCSTSQAKHRLFIGNVPRNWAEDDLKKVVTDAGPGVNKVDLMKDPNNSSRNRGFAFIEYYNHACAEYSRKKMSSSKFKLDTNAPTVSWADPKNGDSASNSQVKAVYVKNLPKDIKENQLKKLFEHHGEITKVVLPPAMSGKERRFGFVHFADRSAALKALKNPDEYQIDGEVLGCSLAKPPSDKKSEVGSNNKKSASQSHQPSRLGYGLAPQNFAQPMFYGGAHAPAGMAMVPMVLPDGRLAYVMQQPGAPVMAQQQGGSRGGSRGGSSGGRKGNDGRRRYQPY